MTNDGDGHDPVPRIRTGLDPRNIPRVAMPRLGDLVPSVENPFREQIERNKSLTEKLEAQRVEVRQQIDTTHAARQLDQRGQLRREGESLRLTAELVAQQQVMIEHQAALVADKRAADAHAKTTRYIEVAVLIVSVLALIVGIVALL